MSFTTHINAIVIEVTIYRRIFVFLVLLTLKIVLHERRLIAH